MYKLVDTVTLRSTKTTTVLISQCALIWCTFVEALTATAKKLSHDLLLTIFQTMKSSKIKLVVLPMNCFQTIIIQLEDGIHNSGNSDMRSGQADNNNTTACTTSEKDRQTKHKFLRKFSELWRDCQYYWSLITCSVGTLQCCAVRGCNNIFPCRRVRLL